MLLVRYFFLLSIYLGDIVVTVMENEPFKLELHDKVLIHHLCTATVISSSFFGYI